MVLLPMVLLLPTLSAAVGGEFKDEHLLRDTSHFRVAIAARAGPILVSWSHIEAGRASTLADPPSPRWGPTGLHRTQNKKYKHFQRDKRKISLSFQGGQRGSRRPYDEARLADLGGVALPGSPAEFGKLIAEDTEKWGKVIPAANIKPQV